MSGTKYTYPGGLVIDLRGEDGNTFFMGGIVIRALKELGASRAECNLFWEELLSGDREHALQTAEKWINVTFIGDRR